MLSEALDCSLKNEVHGCVEPRIAVGTVAAVIAGNLLEVPEHILKSANDVSILLRSFGSSALEWHRSLVNFDVVYDLFRGNGVICLGKASKNKSADGSSEELHVD